VLAEPRPGDERLVTREGASSDKFVFGLMKGVELEA
jgi:hypothetical protein